MPKTKTEKRVVVIVVAVVVLLFAIIVAVSLMRKGTFIGKRAIYGTYKSAYLGTLVLEKDKTFSWTIDASSDVGAYTLEDHKLQLTVEGLDLDFQYVQKEGLLILYADPDSDGLMSLLGVYDNYGIVFYKLDKNGKQITTDTIKTAKALKKTYESEDGTVYTFHKDGSFDGGDSWLSDGGLYFIENDEITLISNGIAQRCGYTLQDKCLTIFDYDGNGIEYWENGDKVISGGTDKREKYMGYSATDLLKMSWSEVAAIYGDDYMYYQPEGDDAYYYSPYYYYESGCPYRFYMEGERIYAVSCEGIDAGSAEYDVECASIDGNIGIGSSLESIRKMYEHTDVPYYEYSETNDDDRRWVKVYVCMDDISYVINFSNDYVVSDFNVSLFAG